VISQEVSRIEIARGLGVQANASIVVINLPTVTVPSIGDLSVEFGGLVRVLRNCLSLDPRLEVDTEGGMSLVLRIMDRRWAWRWRVISGRYNQPDDLTENPNLIRTAREMAALCFEALGESGYDVSVMPDTIGPPVNWVQDSAATALHRICRQYGCEVAPIDSTDTFAVVLLGAGTTPTVNLDTFAATSEFGEKPRPAELQVICGRTLWATWFELEPVIETPSGEYVRFDEADYTPEEGWEEFGDTEHFEGLVDLDNPTETEMEARAAARRSAFRYYRIKSFADGTLDLPGFPPGSIENISECLPLRDLNGEKYASFAPGDRMSPAELRGTFVMGGDPASGNNSPEFTRYDGRWSLRGDQGIVTLARRAYRNVNAQGVTLDQTADAAARLQQADSEPGGGNIRPAKLFLRCLFGVASQELGYTPYREIFSLPMAGAIVPGAQVYVQPQLRVINAVEWAAPTGPIPNTDAEWRPTQSGQFATNYDATQEKALALLNDASLTFLSGAEQSIAYRTLVTADLSGVVRQIRISANGRRGLSSYVSVNQEPELMIRRQSIRDASTAGSQGNAALLQGE
jgi:hypothetical protein